MTFVRCSVAFSTLFLAASGNSSSRLAYSFRTSDMRDRVWLDIATICTRDVDTVSLPMYMILAKRLASPSWTHLHIDTMLSKGISWTHLFRPHISHPYNGYGSRCFALKAASSAPASDLRLETASLNAIAASKKAAPKKRKEKLDPVNTFLTSNSVPGAQINEFPVYSYKHYKPLPTVVYIRHEREANDLIAGLKAGCVFQTYHNYSSILKILS
jgi:hypothetical protein